MLLKQNNKQQAEQENRFQSLSLWIKHSGSSSHSCIRNWYICRKPFISDEESIQINAMQTVSDPRRFFNILNSGKKISLEEKKPKKTTTKKKPNTFFSFKISRGIKISLFQNVTFWNVTTSYHFKQESSGKELNSFSKPKANSLS